MKLRLSDLILVELEDNVTQAPPSKTPPMEEQEVDVDTVKDPDKEEPEPDPNAQPPKSPPQDPPKDGEGESDEQEEDEEQQSGGSGSNQDDKEDDKEDQDSPPQDQSGGGSSDSDDQEESEDQEDQSSSSSSDSKDQEESEESEDQSSSSSSDSESEDSDDQEESESESAGGESSEEEESKEEPASGSQNEEPQDGEGDTPDDRDSEPALKETALQDKKPEYDDQRKALDKLKDAMDTAAKDKSKPKSLSDELKDSLEDLAKNNNGGGYSSGDNTDTVTQLKVNKQSMANGESYRLGGLQMMGSAAQKFKDLVQAEQSRKVIANQRRGRHIDAHALYRTKYATPSDPPRIFKDILPGRNVDCAISIGVDCSGSMSGDKIEAAKKLACAVGYLLQGLKVPCEIVGYSSEGNGGGRHRDNAELVVGQAFGEDFQSARCLFSACGSTPDAAVVEFCIPRLQARSEVKKIFFMIQDGSPDSMEQAIWCREQYEELRAKGIHVFGFGIDADLSRIFGDQHWMPVSTNNLGAFPNLFMNKLRSLVLPQSH